MAQVPLVDLEVIARYSLAIRQESAPAEELLAVLEESVRFVRGVLGGESYEVAPVEEPPVVEEPEEATPAFADVDDDAFGGLPEPDAAEDLWAEPPREPSRRARRARRA